MARTRNLKPGFFSNEILAELPPLTRLLFAGLWTISDRAGRLEDRPTRIKADLLPYDQVDVSACLDDLDRAGFILRYQVQGKRYIVVRNFMKHQNPHPKEAKSEIPPPGPESEEAVKLHGSTVPLHGEQAASNGNSTASREKIMTSRASYPHSPNPPSINPSELPSTGSAGKPAAAPATPPLTLDEWNEPDPTVEGRALVERLAKAHPKPGAPDRAAFAAAKVLAGAVNMPRVIADIEANHAAWCSYWMENPKAFKTMLHVWFESGDYRQRPATMGPIPEVRTRQELYGTEDI